MIVGVDENTAYSWPACNLCGSDSLETVAERPCVPVIYQTCFMLVILTNTTLIYLCAFFPHSQNFHCVFCKSEVDKPDMKIQLEVFLDSCSLRDCTVKVKVRTALYIKE